MCQRRGAWFTSDGTDSHILAKATENFLGVDARLTVRDILMRLFREVVVGGIFRKPV